MKFIDLDQSGSEWLAWRRQGIGASEAAAAIGANPWQSRLELWQRKTGPSESSDENADTRRGKELEPLARQLYCDLYDIEMKPVCGCHDRLPWMRASLDGISPDGKMILEIKSPRRHNYNTKLTEPPEYHFVQIQHQLYVSGADLCHYVTYCPAKYNDGRAITVIAVRPDLDFIKGTLLPLLKEFWECVTTGKPPT